MRLLIILLIMLNSVSFASDLCSSLKSSIDLAMRNAAKVGRPNFDNSAPRETLRQMQLNNWYLKINNMLKIMEINKCTMKETVDENVYSEAALKCVFDNGGEECNQLKWEKNELHYDVQSKSKSK